ncbi:hypothetical protein R5M92_05860 [Halomonas sp. Bachu 37]|uniref:hypothetical protein n=1 Tax=Halomonas kashgarensis TaxID=3084920 RepID=UPI0032164DE7
MNAWFTATVPSVLSAWFFFCIMSLAPVWGNTYPVTPSTLAPLEDDEPVLSMSIDNQQYQLSRAQIESYPLYDVDMEHPAGLEGRFTGVWLDDFLEGEGVSPQERIRLVAHDKYTVFLNEAERRNTRYLLVTRLDGEPLSREQFGPLLLVAPEEADRVNAGILPMTRWIWAIGEIYQQ